MGEQNWQGLARAVSSVLGWGYFFCWSFSFYPQPFLNIRRKSTFGLTVDYPLLNVLGFACYTTSTGAFLFNKTIRHQYAIRNPVAPVPTVRPNDFAFALHALILCIITLSQLWSRLWGFEPTPGKRASRVSQGLFCGSIVGVAIVWIIVAALKQDRESPNSWTEIDVIYAVSYVKLILTIFKYIPQVISNYRAKSTQGWSIHQVLLDFTGGILSNAQLLIDTALSGDRSGVTGNFAKFGLSNVSILFDIIFMVQHFSLYRQKKPTDTDDTEERAGEQRPLLDS